MHTTQLSCNATSSDQPQQLMLPLALVDRRFSNWSFVAKIITCINCMNGAGTCSTKCYRVTVCCSFELPQSVLLRQSIFITFRIICFHIRFIFAPYDIRLEANAVAGFCRRQFFVRNIFFSILNAFSVS